MTSEEPWKAALICWPDRPIAGTDPFIIRASDIGFEAGYRAAQAEWAEERERPEKMAAWLPAILCPTDGVWRRVKLPDGSEVTASFEGEGLGPMARRWRTKSFGYHTPSRPTGEVFGGVEQHSAPFNTFVISGMPEGVYPVYFRPNDTVFGAADAARSLTTKEPG